jgi:cyclopropane fatty-acyl-phospholipid synthase-like methyltransferase
MVYEKIKNFDSNFQKLLKIKEDMEQTLETRALKFRHVGLEHSAVDAHQRYQEIEKFYDEATVDYKYWSPAFNMHYGYLKNPFSFFNREGMLEEMNEQILKRLNIKSENVRLIDMGCGVGATSRHMAKRHTKANLFGVNLVQSHIQIGKHLNRKAKLSNQIKMLYADYHHVPLPKSTADGVFAVESMCHSPNKEEFLQEVHRLLNRGGRFVVSDCFLRSNGPIKNPISRWAYDKFKKNWHVELIQIADLKKHLEENGFKDVKCENIRWRVAPSVMHSPWVVFKYFMGEFLKGKPIGRESLKNIKAVIQSIFLGLDGKNFGYFIVSATKK